MLLEFGSPLLIPSHMDKVIEKLDEIAFTGITSKHTDFIFKSWTELDNNTE